MDFYRNLSFSKPSQFNSTLDVVGCFVEHAETLLLVKRHPDKTHGKTWCLPGGKVKQNEPIVDAMARELGEETGIIQPSALFQPVGTCYIATSGGDFTFHLFLLACPSRPPLTLALDEHTEARWVTLDEAYRLPLITDGAICFEYYKKSRKSEG